MSISSHINIQGSDRDERGGASEYHKLLDYILTTPARDPNTNHWAELDRRWNQVLDGQLLPGYSLFNLAVEAYHLLATEQGQSLEEIIEHARELHATKNAGYAGNHQADPWANFRLASLFDITPYKGVLVRLTDKYSRLKSLRADPNNEQVGESIADTLADLAAYALIGICLYYESPSQQEDYI